MTGHCRAHLRSLDLFSGIGGLTLATRDFLHPVAYCDAWAAAREVVAANIARGSLPRAPICEDVRDLTPRWVKENCARGTRIDAIVAGFPCVGYSAMGQHAGIEHPQTALFHEILRVADDHERDAPLLFLENVPPILKSMPAICGPLERRGYCLHWCLMSARDVGAPQIRQRWFAIAYKPAHRLTASRLARLGRAAQTWAPVIPWKAAAPARMVMVRDRGPAETRASLLGNAVVPLAARYAYQHLITRVITAADSIASADVAPPPKRGAGSCAPGMRGPTVLHKPEPLSFNHGVRIVLDPAAYSPPLGTAKLAKLPSVQSAVTYKYWATPRHSCTWPSNFLTARSIHDLASQIRFATDTRAKRAGFPNPQFIEWLMGYPIDFTHTCT